MYVQVIYDFNAASDTEFARAEGYGLCTINNYHYLQITNCNQEI